jgi:predicted nicotinamide N-methyase
MCASYYRYDCQDEQQLVVRHDPSGSMKCGVGATVWDCALVLCKYLERNPDIVVGKRVLDLSAGVGLVGLVAKKLGAKSVIWTEDDQDSSIINLLGENVGVDNVKPLRWGNKEHVKEVLRSGIIDLVIASDVVCWEELSAPLAETVAQLLKEGGAKRVLLGYEYRSFGPAALFFQLLKDQGIRIDQVPFKDLDSDYQSPDILVLYLSK